MGREDKVFCGVLGGWGGVNVFMQAVCIMETFNVGCNFYAVIYFDHVEDVPEMIGGEK